MRVTARHLERIPRTNLHVPVRDFARVWLTAEIRGDELNAAGKEDSYLFGVQLTCRWLAGVIRTVEGPDGLVSYRSPAPISKRYELAYEELIAEETAAAERTVARGRQDRWAEFAAGARATLAWAWDYSGALPIELRRTRAG